MCLLCALVAPCEPAGTLVSSFHFYQLHCVREASGVCQSDWGQQGSRRDESLAAGLMSEPSENVRATNVGNWQQL